MFEQTRAYLAGGLGRIIAFIPNLLSALVIVAIGYLLSRLAASLVRRVLARVGFDGFVSRRLHPSAGQIAGSPCSAVGTTVLWLGILITASMASRSLGLFTLSAGIDRILAFVPNVLVAVIILGVAAVIARGLGGLLSGVASGVLARIAKVAVMALAVFMALDQIGIARNIVTTTFVALLGAAAVAAAIAFGVGNIGFAREVTERIARRTRERAAGVPGPAATASGPTTYGSSDPAQHH